MPTKKAGSKAVAFVSSQLGYFCEDDVALAAYFDVSTRTVRGWRKAGKAPVDYEHKIARLATRTMFPMSMPPADHDIGHVPRRAFLFLMSYDGEVAEALALRSLREGATPWRRHDEERVDPELRTLAAKLAWSLAWIRHSSDETGVKESLPVIEEVEKAVASRWRRYVRHTERSWDVWAWLAVVAHGSWLTAKGIELRLWDPSQLKEVRQAKTCEILRCAVQRGHFDVLTLAAGRAPEVDEPEPKRLDLRSSSALLAYNLAQYAAVAQSFDEFKRSVDILDRCFERSTMLELVLPDLGDDCDTGPMLNCQPGREYLQDTYHLPKPDTLFTYVSHCPQSESETGAEDG